MQVLDFRALFIEPFTAPSVAARRASSVVWPDRVVWQIAIVVLALSVLLFQLFVRSVPPIDLPPELGMPGVTSLQDLLPSPFSLALQWGTWTLVMSVVCAQMGRAMGGQGSFGLSLLYFSWLRALQIAVFAASAFLSLIFPFLGIAVLATGFVVLLWTLVTFVDELHGFGNLGKAAWVYLLSFFGTFAVLVVIGSVLSIFTGPVPQ